MYCGGTGSVVDESRKMEGGSCVRREELREVADSSSRSKEDGREVDLHGIVHFKFENWKSKTENHFHSNEEVWQLL